MKPSSTRGVPSSASLPDEPPSATANSSRMPLTFDLLISASGEKRCAPKSWWFISQFCGSLSGLRRRSKVTSAARADVPASSRQVNIARSLAGVVLIVRLPFCVVPAKAGTHNHQDFGCRWLCHTLLLRRMGPLFRGDDSGESLLHVVLRGTA